MKKIIILTCILISTILSFNTPISAKAENGGYLRVITEDTAFYSDQALSNFLFYLPYTYYVKVLSDYGSVIHVECYGNSTPAIDGFVLKSALFNDELTVINPYANITLETANNTAFYSDVNCTKVMQYIFSQRNLCFYGKAFSSSGEILYFASYNGKLGYVKEENVVPFVLPIHPNELTFILPNPPEEDLSDTENNQIENDLESQSYVIRIAIILCLIFAGFIALFTIKNPKKQRNSSYYYDENDYS